MKRILFILTLLWSVAQAQTVTPSPGPYTTQKAKYVWTWGKYTGGVWVPGKLIVEDSARFYGLTYVPLAPAGDSSLQAANTMWIKQNISPGTPGQPTSAWNTTGNYFGTLPVEPLLGFKDSAALNIITNGVKRLIIPGAGIAKSTDAAHRVLLLDTATHKVYFGDQGTGGGVSLGQLNDSLARYVTNAFQVDDSLLYIVYGGTAHLFATIHSGGGGVTSVTASAPLSSSGGATPNIIADTTSGNPTSLVTQAQRVKTRDSLNVLIAANAAALGAKLDTNAVYVNAGAINWPGTLYSTPTTGTYGGHKLSYAPTLASQSAYSLFGRGSGSGTPSFLSSIDSNWVTGLHSEAYYNTKYAGIGSLGWKINGNFGTDTSVNWLGTNDNKPLSFRVNGVRAGLLTNSEFRFGNLTGVPGTEFQTIDQNGLTFTKLGTSTRVIKSGPNGALSLDAFYTTNNGILMPLRGSIAYVSSVQSGGSTAQYAALTLISNAYGTTPIESMSFQDYFASTPKRIIIYGRSVGSIDGPVSIVPSSQGNLIVGGFVSADVSTSKFTVISTTQGVSLAPKTATQQAAIASPATGLINYNTTLKRITWYDGSAWRYSPVAFYGTAAPTTTPVAVGDTFTDTTNKKGYVATGTSSSSDWTILN